MANPLQIIRAKGRATAARNSGDLVMEAWRLRMAKQRGELIPSRVLRELSASNLPCSKRTYNRRLKELLAAQ